eukprot:jgi/Tetstr1/442286/TSEL_030427.t1
MRDFFGTLRGACTHATCPCTDYVSQLSVLTDEEEGDRGGGRLMSCQARSELTLTCTCGHGADKHHSVVEQPSQAREAAGGGQAE